MMHNPIIKIPVYLIVDYESPFHFGFNYRGIFPALNNLWFDLANLTQQIAVFFFTSNMLVKRHSDFLAFIFLNGVGFMGYLGLLSNNHSVIETIAASRISLNCC